MNKKVIEHKGRKIEIKFNPIFYEPYLISKGGFLSKDMACHAMFYAYTIAQANVKEIQEKLFYEGEPDQVYNFRDLFKRIAEIYDTDPDKMWAFIFPVEQQLEALGLSLIPRSFFDRNKVERGTNDTIFERKANDKQVEENWTEILKDATINKHPRRTN